MFTIKMNSFEKFCGGPLWNRSLTWDTTNPDFTVCFSKTFLMWSPGFIFFVLFVFELPLFIKSKSRNVPWTRLNISKLIFIFLLLCTTVITAIVGLHKELSSVNIIGYIVLIGTYLGSGLLLLASLRFGLQTSASQLFLYTMAIVARSVLLRHEIIIKDGTLLITLSTVHLILVVVMLFLNFFADSTPLFRDLTYRYVENPSPQLTSSFISKLTFSWITCLLKKGYKRPLQRADLWDMNPDHATESVMRIFSKYFDPIAECIKRQSDNKYADTEQSSASRRRAKFYSVLPSLIRSFGPKYFGGFLLKFLQDVFVVASPQILKLVINFVQSYTDQNKVHHAWKGYFFVCLLFCCSICQNILLAQYYERMFAVAMNVRASLTSTIYKKSLKLSISAKNKSTLGEIVNLMSVDIQRVSDVLPYLNAIWSAPFQITMSSYFVYQELGVASFSGLLMLLVAIPINALLTALIKRYQNSQMKHKDLRIMLMNEILAGIKVLKLYAWEDSFEDQVGQIRKNEIHVLRKCAISSAFISFFWISVPFLIAVVSFSTYVLLDANNVLSAEKTFVTLSYLNIMRIPMVMLPFLFVNMMQATVSLKRINVFLNNDELNDAAVEHKDDKSVVIQNGTFSWNRDMPNTLSEININIKEGFLTAVLGVVGSGKSSLISAILGEIDKVEGTVTVGGSIAYVAQKAWLQNDTAENNILFGMDKNDERYDSIIEASALRPDINMWPGGDKIEIGERGINLSGGQKQRICLARATYSNSDIYLLDDPLSAVDAHVGKHIFDNIIGKDGLLRGKTRILVTHSIAFLDQVDFIIVMKNGRIDEQGTYAELIENDDKFASFLMEYQTDELESSKHIEENAEKGGDVGLMGVKVTKKDYEVGELKAQKEQPGIRLIEKEATEVGNVSISVYLYYLKNIGFAWFLIYVFFQVLYQASTLGTNYWLSVWSGNELGNSSLPKYRNIYLKVYGSLGFLQSLFAFTLRIILTLSTLGASRLLHKHMLKHVLYSPMSFFDTTPLGRIVNRFSKDIDVCDSTLPMNLGQWMSMLGNFLGTIVLITSVVPLFVVIIIPTIIIFIFIQRIYVSTSRQLKRLESVSRSPIYSHFSESLSGSTTIRAFGHSDRFIKDSEHLVDQYQACYYPSMIANRWLAIRLEILGNLITVFAALLSIMDPEAIGPSKVGLIISYALNVTSVLNWLVRISADVENNIVSVERIMEYSVLPSEAARFSHKLDTIANWPEKGIICFNNYAMRYREGLNVAIENINASIRSFEKIGIVGRTGAGKSSLVAALFRLSEPVEGSVVIDNVDISELGLSELRDRLTIIPQDPVLFSGSMRKNLDPFGRYSDELLWSALELSNLKDFVLSLSESGCLEYKISEGGSNLSVGQRQLVCLARALLKNSKVLVLDEATAAVDLETDELIQRTIRSQFANATVLTIAHRLNTILDYDRIMVMSDGHLVEFDSPSTLLKNKNGLFYSLASNAGLVSRSE